MLGKIINDKYKIEEVLGKGTFGIVYLAINININKKVVLKFLKENWSDEETLNKRFKHEALAASQIGHSNIVEVFDFDKTADGVPFIVMEYLKGKPLSYYIKKNGQFVIQDALYIILQILDALNAAHSKNIIHRDIKPDNIFVCDNGKVKILDFGIAKIQGNTFGTQQIGTPGYMAPELIENGNDVDFLSDIYSVGIVFYELLTGRKPYIWDSNQNIQNYLKRILFQEPYSEPKEINESIDEKLNNIVLKSISFKKEKRFQNVSELIDAIEKYKDKNAIIDNLNLDCLKKDKEEILKDTECIIKKRNKLIKRKLIIIVGFLLLLIYIFFTYYNSHTKEIKLGSINKNRVVQHNKSNKLYIDSTRRLVRKNIEVVFDIEPDNTEIKCLGKKVNNNILLLETEYKKISCSLSASNYLTQQVLINLPETGRITFRFKLQPLKNYNHEIGIIKKQTNKVTKSSQLNKDIDKNESEQESSKNNQLKSINEMKIKKIY